MSSLFIKIFVWFWLAIVVVACIVFSETYYVPPNRPLADRTVAPLLAQEASRIFEEHGPSEFPQRFRDFDKAFQGALYFFDERGKELQGLAAPAEVLQISQRAALAPSDQTLDATFDRRRLVAQRTTGTSGRRYILVRELSYPGVSEFLRAPLRIVLLRLLAVLMMSSLVCFWLAHYITAPLRRLRSAANRLASGDLAARVDNNIVERRDEIAQLSRDFNNMAQKIESLVSAQKRLVTDISHEVRSPLARMTIALGLARRHADAQTTAALDRIERESERLNELIGNLLKLSRLEGGAVSPRDMDHVALHQLIDEVAMDANYEARGRNRAVRVSHIEPCWILGVQELMRSAIENVVRNGINYTKYGTEVEINLHFRQSDSTAVIHVRDHGDGVPIEHLGDIFYPFFRIEDARERSSGGTGLGLAITERTIQLHQGNVKAENARGGGLLVELKLPASASVSAAS